MESKSEAHGVQQPSDNDFGSSIPTPHAAHNVDALLGRARIHASLNKSATRCTSIPCVKLYPPIVRSCFVLTNFRDVGKSVNILPDRRSSEEWREFELDALLAQ